MKTAFWFMMVDLLFWVLYWLFGVGYLEFPSVVESRWFAMTFLAELSNFIHAPVSWLFGPYLFRHMAADTAMRIGAIALGVYVLLCLVWSFAIGYCIARVAQWLGSEWRRRA